MKLTATIEVYDIDPVVGIELSDKLVKLLGITPHSLRVTLENEGRRAKKELQEVKLVERKTTRPDHPENCGCVDCQELQIQKEEED